MGTGQCGEFSLWEMSVTRSQWRTHKCLDGAPCCLSGVVPSGFLALPETKVCLLWLRLGHMYIMWPRTTSPQTKPQAIPILNPVELLNVNFRIISKSYLQSPRARHNNPQ